MVPFLHSAGWLVALSLLAGCYDAPRDNPFDPALTPPVELQVALDDTAGTATLTWTRYAGQQPFEEYRVLRKEPGLEKVDTLAHLININQITYVDTSLALDTDYGYRVEVVNAGGYAAASQEQGARPLNLPAVELQEPVFESATASASLRWARYAGPRFKAYQVLRRTAELAAQVVKESANIADTSFVNEGLEGNIEYFYQVVVVTERDEKVESEERSGIFHKLLDTWPLEGPGRPFVRLYREGEGIAALIFGATQGFSQQVRLYDPEGQFQEEMLGGLEESNVIRLEAMALAPGERRFFNISWVFTDLGGRPLEGSGILSLSPDGKLVIQERELFTDVFSEPLRGEEGKVLGEISLRSVASGSGKFENVTVSTGGQQLFAEDFSTFPEGDLAPGVKEGWEFLVGSAGSPQISSGALSFGGLNAAARREDASWQDFRLEADVIIGGSGSRAGIQIGGDTFSRFALWLDVDKQQAILEWVFAPPEGSGLEPRSESFPIPFQVLPSGLPYRLGLEVVEGKVSISVKNPVVWEIGQGSYLSQNSLAATENTLAFTLGNQSYSVTLEGEAIPLLSFPSRVSEIRVWEGRRGKQMGICLPELNEIRLGLVPAGAESEWSTFLASSLGPRLGAGRGFLFNPTSFDVGSDGRIYVLDAGNARIAVFSQGREYITQWGRQGSGPGEFNFGQGAPAPGGGLDFAGSVAVDSQGFIYVADELNKRIQKFAP